MSFKKFTGVQKGWKLGLDSLLLNLETLMWILLITFYAFLGIFKAFLKILHKI